MPGPCAYPRFERITRKRDYLEVFEQGQKRVGRAFICYVVRREGQGRRFGLAVSRKVGSAVVRNRVKRYLKEIYRANRLRLADDARIVIVARPAAANLDYRQCVNAVQRLLDEGDVLRG
ncbi:MAG: hypothetical protein AMXMBFR4_00170 [Candidatus Hydrogenedentota bacterium]